MYTEAELYALMRPRKVCVCKQVSEEQIVRAIRNGSQSLDSISKATNAMTGCGTCAPSVSKILERELINLQKEGNP